MHFDLLQERPEGGCTVILHLFKGSHINIGVFSSLPVAIRRAHKAGEQAELSFWELLFVTVLSLPSFCVSVLVPALPAGLTAQSQGCLWEATILTEVTSAAQSILCEVWCLTTCTRFLIIEFGEGNQIWHTALNVANVWPRLHSPGWFMRMLFERFFKRVIKMKMYNCLSLIHKSCYPVIEGNPTWLIWCVVQKSILLLTSCLSSG